MKTIGLLGGMTWESTVGYYEIINREVQTRLGGLHSARIVMHSLDFEDVAALQRVGNWEKAAALLSDAGKGLVRSGAEFLALCCNTMHCVSPAIERETRIPLLHIADPLGEAIVAAGLKRIAILGTRYTMEMPAVLTARLAEKYGIEGMTPEGKDASELHRIIYEELGCGIFLDRSRAWCRALMAKLGKRGAQGIALACTELPLILKPEDSALPQFDTMRLHATAIARAALEGDAP